LPVSLVPTAIASILAVTIAGAGPASAGGLDFDLVGARSIGRAGTTTVSGDGGSALVFNPAGLARSTSLRVQVGLSLHDDDASYRAPDAEVADSPTVADRGPPAVAPSAAVQGAIGPVVVGAGVLELGHLDRLMPAPAFGQTDPDVDQLFPHRYGGLELRYRRRVAVVGAAMRVGEWLGVGVSLGAADVELGERRRIWAGFASRDELAYPTNDLDLTLSAADHLVPFATAGALAAPPSLPIELGVAVSWSADAYVTGGAALGRTFDRPYPMPLGSAPEARLRLGMPAALRAGARYLGDRVQIEVGAELTWFSDAGKLPTWRTSGLAVRDETGEEAAVGDVPSLVALRDHTALRGALDVEVVSGLLWLTAGYAHSSGATARSHVSAAFGDIAAHTVSLGAEGTWNQITFALGVARRLSPSVDLAPEDSDVLVENPFDAGTASAGAGRHKRAHDAVGLTMEIAWE
jgi:hypothetical protein